jgi:tetratricopeptide (TPR) repeat protein
MSLLALLAQAGPRSRTLARQLPEAEGPEAARLWLEAADVFLALEDMDRVHEALTEGRACLGRGIAPGLRGELEWRLGQVSEVLGRPQDARTHYDAAADAFRADGSPADEAVARLRLAELTLYGEGAGHALRPVGEAIAAAREAGDKGVLLQALLLSGELHAEGGAYEDAVVRLKEVVRLAREQQGAYLQEELAAWIGLAEAHLALDDARAAIAAAQEAGPGLELAPTALLAARASGIVVLLMLEAGERGEELDKAIARARKAFADAMDRFAFARFLMRVGRRIEARDGPAAAIPWFAEAWNTVEKIPERFRTPPIAFALARAHADNGSWILADLAIEEALARVIEVNDLEGLRICTELGVTIAVNLEVPGLAIRRLVTLARARAAAGDNHGRTRSLIAAFEVALKSSHEDPRGVAEELMDALREGGPGQVGPDELVELARLMSFSGFADLAQELHEAEATRAMMLGRPHDTARHLVAAARACWRDGRDDEGEELFKRAMNLALTLGLKEVDGIRLDTSGMRSRGGAVDDEG